MKITPLNIRATLDKPAPTLDFVLPGLLAGSAGSVVGSGGIGKTTFLMQVGIAISTGMPTANEVFPANGEPSRVVYIAAEESLDILRIRLKSIFNLPMEEPKQKSLEPSTINKQNKLLIEQNLQLVPAAGHSVYLIKDGKPTEFYEDLCQFCKGARLVVIDPLRRLHDGDENSSAAMTQVVQVLETLAKRTGAAVIVAHHMNKGSAFAGITDSAAASRGSSALTDAVRWQLNMSGMSEQEAKGFGLAGEHKAYLRLDFAKTNYAAPQPTIWMKRLDGGALTRVNLEKPARRGASTSRKSKSVAELDKEIIYV
jgi:RecA-family ATPase